MKGAYLHVCLLLIITMCGEEGADTSAIGGKILSGRLDTLNVEKRRFTRTSCQWNQGNRALMCEDLHLRTVPRNLPSGAVKLNLHNNKIGILLNTSFKPYPNLVSLDLSINEIKTIQPGAFKPLKHLEFLDLSRNHNLVIPNSVLFQPLDALISLDISMCKLKSVPNDFMNSLPHLQHLDLSSNHLSSLNMSRCRTYNLTSVALNDNSFSELTPDKFVFACPTDLFGLLSNPIRYVSEEVIARLTVNALYLGMEFAPTTSVLLNITTGFARSNISGLLFAKTKFPGGIPIEVFNPLRNHTFITLFIDCCGDLSLSKDIFFGLRCVKLVLTKNFIGNIEPEYFRGMPRLQLLHLWRNQVTAVNPFNTTWESNLEELDLSDNQIQNIKGHDLRGLRNLKSLNLSHNVELFVLDLNSYDGLESLEVVDVSNTLLVTIGLSFGVSQFYLDDHIPSEFEQLFIPGQTFNNTINLQLIEIISSQLNIGSIWDFDHSISLFKGLVNLEELYLSNNPLENFPDRVFEDNWLLAYLEIDNCAISSLSGNVFHGLESLIYLNLNRNNLHILSTNVFTHLPTLLMIEISDNKLMFVEEGTMERVPFLENVGLSNNRLVSFNRSTWNTLRKYNSIDVSGNPFSCQCNFEWLYDLANSPVLHENKTLCSGDSVSKLRGKPLLAFDPSSYCVPNIALISTLPFVALALLIGLLLAFHNRWMIRYKLFLLKLAIVGYIEIQDAREHEEFLFDINIMFTEADELWAREHLRPTLEERLPDYDRYSFGDDDLTLGMHYLEAVHYAVEHSFKTIMLLSRRAVRDNWFLIKFRTAIDHVHDELTENTVVIFLEDIPEDEIPYLVRLYLSDRRPYMRWPEDLRGHDYFWNELTKVVTVNLRYNPLIPPE